MPWPATFVVLVVSHAVGDFLLQTEWQALNKYAGLRRGRSPRALLAHLTSYTVAFLPALVWLGTSVGGWAPALGAAIVLPHLVQDDGRLVEEWIRAVKHADIPRGNWLFTAIDQSFHVLALFGVALLASI